MATQITNYQCPACTGPLQFSAQTGKMACEYCGSAFDVAEIEALYKDKEQKAAENMAEAEAKSETVSEGEWDASGLEEGWGAEADSMRAYNCPSCGAELICDEHTAATACPYCGNPTVVPGKFTGTLKPDYVLPFKLDKKSAINALKKHYKGKIFLPGTFTQQQTVEKIQGIYVPFWLYDGIASGDFTFHATRVHRHTRGNQEITETSHYNVYRSGSVAFEKVPVDASSKMPDDYMDSIEPYDYKELKPFSSAYLPGFLADKFDVSVEDSNKRADTRFTGTLESEMTKSVTGYSSCVAVSRSVRLKRGKVRYAMLPVWLLNVKWNNKTYLFAVNGQSGRTAGNLPVSGGKVLAFFAAVAAPLSALAAILAMMM